MHAMAGIVDAASKHIEDAAVDGMPAQGAEFLVHVLGVLPAQGRYLVIAQRKKI